MDDSGELEPGMMHVVCTADDRFAADCAVMLASLVDTNDPAQLHVHLVHDDTLSEPAVSALAGIVRASSARCSTLDVPDAVAGSMPASPRFPRLIWYRAFLPDLLPDLDRVLYLDTDTLVTASLRPLWEANLEDSWVGAVTNPLFESMARRVKDQLGLHDATEYFNSGVLLLDLDALRSNHAVHMIERFAAEHPGQPWPDQDALNAVLRGHRLSLHPRWNAMPGLFQLPKRYLPHTRDEVRAAAQDPAVVHFVGPHKPWHYRCRHPYQDQWFHYLRTTPWAGRETEGRTTMNVVLRRLPPLWALRLELGAAAVRQRTARFSGRLRARIS